MRTPGPPGRGAFLALWTVGQWWGWKPAPFSSMFNPGAVGAKDHASLSVDPSLLLCTRSCFFFSNLFRPFSILFLRSPRHRLSSVWCVSLHQLPMAAVMCIKVFVCGPQHAAHKGTSFVPWNSPGVLKVKWLFCFVFYNKPLSTTPEFMLLWFWKAPR